MRGGDIMRRPKILVAGSFVLDQIAVTKTVPGEGAVSYTHLDVYKRQVRDFPQN